MANTIVERCRCLHAVVDDSVSESCSDLFLMRSTIGKKSYKGGFETGSSFKASVRKEYRRDAGTTGKSR